VVEAFFASARFHKNDDQTQRRLPKCTVGALLRLLDEVRMGCASGLGPFRHLAHVVPTRVCQVGKVICRRLPMAIHGASLWATFDCNDNWRARKDNRWWWQASASDGGNGKGRRAAVDVV